MARLSDEIRDRVMAMAPDRPRPWDGWPGAPGSARRALWPRWAGAMAAVVVVAVLAGSTLLREGPTPTAPLGATPEGPGSPKWFLSADELARAVEAAQVDKAYDGKVVIADIPGLSTTVGCPLGSVACPWSIRVSGHAPISVVRLDLATPCSPVGGCIPRVPQGPMALRIHSGSKVDFIQNVLVRPRDREQPWTVDDLPAALDGQAAVVDAWLTWWSQSVYCPHIGMGWYGCGAPAWLTAEPAQLERITRASDGGMGWSGHAPDSGIRVQNGVHGHNVVVNPAGAQSPAPSEHGLFLLRDAPFRRDDVACMACLPRTAWLLDSIDVITVPPEPAATERPSTETRDPSGFDLLTPARLLSLVRDAETTGAGVGRTVVADVTFEAGGDCGGTPLDGERCYPVLAGSNPPIRLFHPPHGCPPPFRCALILPPYLPAPGPAAVSIRADGGLDWVGSVSSQSDGTVEWPFNDFRGRLGRLSPLDPAAYDLYVVPGWMSALSGVIDCFGPLPSGIDPEYDPCAGQGRPVWLTGGRPVLGQGGMPLDTIRLQNTAFQIAGATDTGLGAYLVRPHFVTTCTDCDTAAELVARLDPP